MKKNILLGFLFTFFLFSNLIAKEISFYDSKGAAVAYIDTDDELTIYLWQGKPVAYLVGDSIYGFNGKHLGWLEDGIIRDHSGNAVGFTKGSVNMFTQFESFKGFKAFKPFKAFKEFAPLKPFYSNSWSKTDLSLFLSQGRN